MQRLDVLDMVINQLRDFEDRLDTQISTLELQIEALEAVVRKG
jgi:chaperonin cofactor prefoldin